MMSLIRVSNPGVLRIAIVSPGGVSRELKVIPEVIDELNRGIGLLMKCVLQWENCETSCAPGFNDRGAQGQVDQYFDIQNFSLVIGIFGGRFGTPTHGFGPGTEYEINQACQARKDHGRPEIMLFFNTKLAIAENPEDSEQWTQALRYKEKMKESGMVDEYEKSPQFERKLRQAITKWLIRIHDQSLQDSQARLQLMPG